MSNENQYQPLSFPEAGGVAFATVYSKTGVAINITARAVDTQTAMKDLFEAIMWGITEYGLSTDKPMPPAASAPQSDSAAAILAADGNKQAAAEVQQAVLTVPPSKKGNNIQYQTIDVDIVEVLPQPDGKTTLKFYGASDRYPRVSVNKWKIEAANGLMKHVTSEPMDKAAKYTLKCRVYFTDGAAYTTDGGETRHYKDVEHVRPIA